MSTATATLRRLFNDADRTPNLSTNRGIGRETVRRALRAAKAAKRRIRFYSQAGFVPTSYKWPCLIWYVEGRRASDGAWTWDVSCARASRPYGRGNLEVVR